VDLAKDPKHPVVDLAKDPEHTVVDLAKDPKQLNTRNQSGALASSTANQEL